jgi:uncharacterized membrane protein YbaN (DUF454 family)
MLFNILGTLFLLGGILGVVLALLPAIPFLLVAMREGDRGQWAHDSRRSRGAFRSLRPRAAAYVGVTRQKVLRYASIG